MELKIRRATARDADDIRRVHITSIRRICKAHYTPEQIDTWAEPPEPRNYARRVREAIVYVAEDADNVVGFSIMNPEKDEVRALYVHPEHVRRGIGRRLLVALEAEARSVEVSTITLKATLNSVAFYQSCGFSSLGEGTNAHPSGLVLPCVRLEKRLSEVRER